MNIGITCYPTLGGSGVVATELGKILAERGHCVHFITSGIPFRLGKFYRNIYYHEVEVNDYSVFRYPPYDLSLASKMAQVAQMVGLDLLHVHYAVPHAISAILAKQMVGDSLKVVTTLHGTDITVLGYDHNLSSLIRFGIEKSDAVTAVSRSLIQETRDLLQINRDIELIYNFVDKRLYYRREAEDLKREYAPHGEKILIHISNFRPVKRVSDVVKTFEIVRREHLAKLVLIGEGPELPKIRELVYQLKLENDIIFLGKQEDVSQVLSMADILLLPSEKESFGLVALEAMACGLPVIGANAGGLPEVIVHEKTGFLAPVGNVQLMAKYALILLSDDKLREKMGNASINRCYHYFCQDDIVDQYEQLYHRLTLKT
ncbi:N-acetyl-alpha-D-glucosaminyl L-malate synthase BshA [Microaerobacter geothermalis]|uniref:N-acetyl-alpha-D-glucosaminyl L-malate synthase BshA n=1 Tax=Microaerobacter geothermalis TaxID=674972 RepID=UPI001F42F61A|nr:N-acetyl-alpha-D-glucosaminyl L-malate synthase BshA [Microaerobacter geothermalis]MCF6093353.1 N-acetyl-alpha-D-glucosaminyl L-malate synthase BshA [Microaerobacter geothermalis]